MLMVVITIPAIRTSLTRLPTRVLHQLLRQRHRSRTGNLAYASKDHRRNLGTNEDRLCRRDWPPRIARVLVRLDHVVRVIPNADHKQSGLWTCIEMKESVSPCVPMKS